MRPNYMRNSSLRLLDAMILKYFLDEISVEAGFKVQIHVQEEPPFIHELGFGISPGFQTLVATQEQRVSHTFFFTPIAYKNSTFNQPNKDQKQKLTLNKLLFLMFSKNLFFDL